VLVAATANPDKLTEIEEVLHGLVELVPRPAGLADVVEDAETLEGNARLKASAVCRAARAAAIADDTALEVDALDGRPGVRSSRYAGEGATYAQNVAHLLDELTALGAVDPIQRRARFRTVALIARPDGSEAVAEGRVDGTIAAEPRGAGGFGYDPVFVPDEGDGRTFAEMTSAEKHAVSHRGRAFRSLAAALQSDGRTS
jgi:XTP/dITP diphosphohydrolase